MNIQGDVTTLLQQINKGDQGAWEELFPKVKNKLSAIAHNRLQMVGRRAGLETRDLLGEFCLAMLNPTGNDLQSRLHLYRWAAMWMQRHIVDQLRKGQTRKHGGWVKHVNVDDVSPKTDPNQDVFLLINEILLALKDYDELCYQVAVMRYFVGHTIEQTAQILGIPRVKVSRKWQEAVSYIDDELRRQKFVMPMPPRPKPEMETTQKGG